MIQPELGKKLADLRQDKGLTQEELVEACNVSVRTIQRIESGEVTPRMSTIKILLSALEASLDDIETDVPAPGQPDRRTKQWLQIGWISGLVYLVIGGIEVFVDYSRFQSESMMLGFDDSFPFDIQAGVYITVKLVAAASYALFALGFIALAGYFKNYLLKIAFYLMLGTLTVMTIVDIVTLFVEVDMEPMSLVLLLELVVMGGVGIVIGLGMFRLQDGMGKLAFGAGVLELIMGISMVTVILVFIGLVLWIPTLIVEIVLLYKGYDYLRSLR